MKAAVYQRYGSPSVIEIKDVDKPIPGDHEVLIRVMATTVSSADSRLRSANFPQGFGLMGRLVIGVSGPRKPILGTELAGVIEGCGKKVKRFRIGDPVIAVPGAGMGAHVEYFCMPESGLVVTKPEALSFEQAAALSFGGQTALYFLRDRAKLQAGESVLIVGAGGAVGSAAVQLARFFGAEVTGVCRTDKLDLVQSIGAQHVIDYTRSDFTKLGRLYDVIFDSTGTLSASRCQEVLNEGGRVILAVANLKQMLQALWPSLGKERKVITGYAADKVEAVQFLVDLASKGEFMPVVDRTYPFLQIAQAHAYVDEGHKKGSVVISMS
ncbi:MAG: NAD(P)-dependent alcohol dehydrogenase [Oligoflexus sp.]